MQELDFYVEILCLMVSAELKLLWKDLTLEPSYSIGRKGDDQMIILV
jgi:hypothetical protein